MPPAQCGKKSFGTVWDNTVSILRQGLLLHCSARCAEALLALPNDNECQNKNVLAHDFVYRSFCVPKDKTNPLAIRFSTHGGIRTREYRAWQAQGASVLLAYTLEHPRAPLWRIWLKHRLEVTLQAYFTILFTVFHGKKAAKITKKPSNESFFVILIHNLTVFSAFRWLIF